MTWRAISARPEAVGSTYNALERRVEAQAKRRVVDRGVARSRARGAGRYGMDGRSTGMDSTGGADAGGWGGYGGGGGGGDGGGGNGMARGVHGGGQGTLRDSWVGAGSKHQNVGAGPGRYCSPRHRHPFEPYFLDMNGIP